LRDLDVRHNPRLMRKGLWFLIWALISFVAVDMFTFWSSTNGRFRAARGVANRRAGVC